MADGEARLFNGAPFSTFAFRIYESRAEVGIGSGSVVIPKPVNEASNYLSFRTDYPYLLMTSNVTKLAASVTGCNCNCNSLLTCNPTSITTTY